MCISHFDANRLTEKLGAILRLDGVMSTLVPRREDHRSVVIRVTKA
jgi:hypothetical protein